MLNRHTLRVKVLQLLYAHAQDDASTPMLVGRNYQKVVSSAYRLYLYNIHFLERLSGFARKDYEMRLQKRLPTEKDQLASLRLYENPVFQSIRQNQTFNQLLKTEFIPTLVDDDFVWSLFQKFSQTEYYGQYIGLENPPLREHQYCLVNLYKFLLQEELFTDTLEDLFPLWEEDFSLLYAAVKNTARELPTNPEFYTEYSPNMDFVDNFGKKLLQDALGKEQELQPIINEKLQNWDESRIALMDLLIIRMALCEFLYHPSIPTKVTIDEYVSIAKEYSTEKSKRFVNGILDRLMKDLHDQGKIQKTGRGLMQDNNPLPNPPKEEKED